MKRPPPPVIDPRCRDDILADLNENLPGYTPNWQPRKGAASGGLMRVFARYLEIFGQGLNRLPERYLLAFLDSLGISLLPAQAARVPLVFTLLPDSPMDVTLPANSQVAAPPQPIPPSPLQPEPAADPQPIVFATERTITLSRGKLAVLYSVDPGSDAYADHTAALTESFTLFDRMDLTPHELYLGHDELFKLAGNITVLLSIAQSVAAERELAIAWEYLTDVGWLPLSSLAHEDTTYGLTQAHGQIALRRTCGPDAKEETIHGRKSYWIRGRLTSPLPPPGLGGLTRIPRFDTVRVCVEFSKDSLQPDAAFADTTALDTSKDFYPFGPRPARFSTFYLASEDVFQRKGASVRLDLGLSQPGDPKDEEDGTPFGLRWEYYSGRTWKRLLHTDYRFTEDQIITFACPRDWAETEVNGEKNYWLRVRILDGDYGKPLHATTDTNGSVTLAGPTLQPPVVESLTLGYAYQTDVDDLDHCVTYNDFVHADHSDDCRWRRRTFSPFQPVSDLQPAVHFGFDQPLPPGLLSLYVHVPHRADTPATDVSPYIWEYRSERDWRELSMLDETLGFRRSGTIQFIGPREAARTAGLGGPLYRIRARLKRGTGLDPAPVAGVWLNGVWGIHRLAFTRDVLGRSDGNPRQTFPFPRGRTPVLAGEVIEICELSAPRARVEWRLLAREVLGDDERVIQDLEERLEAEGLQRDVVEGNLRLRRDGHNRVSEVWVRWRGQEHLYNAGPNDRVYVIERASGWLRFGDGQQGMIPPAGAQVAASCTTGGGSAGNVPAHTVEELRVAVPAIMGVINPIPASGGAAAERMEMIQRRGPQIVRHHGRAVSAADFEWLAKEASPAVARARCLPLVGSDGKAQRGWVTLAIVPYSTDPQPRPTSELLRQVRDHLARRVPAAVARRVRVVGLTYVLVSVRAEIVPQVPGEAALVGERVRRRLTEFLHPLTGGFYGEGWEFGQLLCLSQVASVIETTPGVDYTRQVVLLSDDGLCGQTVDVGANGLLASGRHELKLTLGEE